MIDTTFKQLSNESRILDGPLLITPRVFGDERGFFYESWNELSWKNNLKKYGQNFEGFVQDNHSKSCQGVLRGLHYQKNPYCQGKLVRCISGEIFDVAIDIRKNSATFGLWVGEVLSSQNKNQLWIPEGFAHGFLTISESAEVCYKTTNFWDKDSEKSIIWNDKNINIKWPLYKLKNKKIILSDKDEKAPCLNEINEIDLF